MRRSAGHIHYPIVEECDLIVGAPEQPQPVMLAVAEQGILRSAIKQTGGNRDASIDVRPRDKVHAADALNIKQQNNPVRNTLCSCPIFVRSLSNF